MHRGCRLAIAVIAVGRPAAAPCQSLADGALQIAVYSTSVSAPGFFEFLPAAGGGPVECLVGETITGRVLHLRDGTLAGVAVDLAVASLFERGLFGLALHPHFADSAFVYVYYTKSNTGADTQTQGGALDNRVVRFAWTGSALVGETLLVSLPVGPNHNGGALAFGPDGMLYGSIGEAGSTNGQLQNVATGAAPNNTSMVFRIQPDGAPPTGNPFAAVPGMERVFAYGLRNVFGLDFDPWSGQLWNTDNGASTYDEVNRVTPGMNGGWRRLMGPAARDPSALGNLWTAPGAAYVDPQFSFLQSFGITALHFLRSDALGEHYAGDLFVAAHNSRTVYHFEPTGDRLGLVMPDSALADGVADTPEERDRFAWASGVGVITDIGTGPDGALYLLRYESPSQVYRIWRPKTSDAGTLRPRSQLVFVPNPFRDNARSRLPAGEARGAWIYALNGARLRFLAPESGVLRWDGRDDGGRAVAAGVYFVRLQSQPQAAPLKLVRVD